MTAPCMLEHPAPLLQISDRKLRGVVSQLEAGQAERLWEQLPEAYRSLHADKDPPTVALRLAPQHAMLCLLKHWPRACVPNVSSPKSQKKGTGSKTLYIDWSLLGIRPATLQRQYKSTGYVSTFVARYRHQLASCRCSSTVCTPFAFATIDGRLPARRAHPHCEAYSFHDRSE